MCSNEDESLGFVLRRSVSMSLLKACAASVVMTVPVPPCCNIRWNVFHHENCIRGEFRVQRRNERILVTRFLKILSKVVLVLLEFSIVMRDMATCKPQDVRRILNLKAALAKISEENGGRNNPKRGGLSQ